MPVVGFVKFSGIGAFETKFTLALILPMLESSLLEEIQSIN